MNGLQDLRFIAGQMKGIMQDCPEACNTTGWRGTSNMLDLAEGEQADYEVIKEKLVEKMKPMGFVALEKFHKQKMQTGEAVTMFS